MSSVSLTTATAALPLAPAAAESSTNEPSSSNSQILANSNQISPSTTALATNPAICKYFQRGICRFGTLCRFSHDAACGEMINNTTSFPVQEQPSTSRRNWVNAPVFVPKTNLTGGEIMNEACALDMAASSNRSWADVVGTGANRVSVLNMAEPGSMKEMCPFESPCPFGLYCSYSLHMELCEMCDQFCLHPKDEAQRKKHKKECLQQHEQAMELSFAIARSKDKTCGICFDTIMEKAGREKRFGILPNCNHIFCLECIRKWRQAKQFEHKITRSCPECRVSSDFVCPSAFWVETKEEKEKLLGDYRKALGVKDCKYFKKGDGKCPFGNKCFYKHALPNGDLVDVGCPKKGRKMHRSSNEIINLLDIYLYEFLEQRDLSFLEFLASTSDESDFGEDYDD